MKDEVVHSLEEQVGCYRRLAKLAELQHVHVQQEQTEALLDVLKHRQKLMEQIAQLEHLISPARRDWQGYVSGIEVELRARAESLVGEIRRLLEQITAADQHDALVLQQRKLSLGKQINQASAARQVNRTYAAAAYGTRQSRMNVQR
jgi:flagellar biosynthesis/type III secretory pathway chaperone